MSRKLTLKRKDADTLTLSGLDSFLCEMLQSIPVLGTPGEASAERFFPSPTGGKEAQVDEDWASYVRPELEEQFSETRNCIAEDLKKMRDKGRSGMELDIPDIHRWQWIHGLNQARLALATVHGLGEAELEQNVPLQAPAAMAAFQIQLYGLLQEWLLTEFSDDEE